MLSVAAEGLKKFYSDEKKDQDEFDKLLGVIGGIWLLVFIIIKKGTGLLISSFFIS